MKITVVTVVFNGVGTIEDAMESVLSQRLSRHSLEYIVVDGGSTDGTVEKIRAFADRCGRLESPAFAFRWISERDRGLYDAINKGVRLASGDVVGICNADDALAADDVVESIADSFNDNTDLFYGDVRFVRAGTGVQALREAPVTRYCTGRFFRRWMFRFATFPAHPSTFVRRDLLLKDGGYSLSYRICADFELMLRLFYRERVRATYRPLCTHVMRSGGLSTGGIRSNLEINREDLAALRANGVWSCLPLIYLKYFFKIWGFVFRRKAAVALCLMIAALTLSAVDSNGFPPVPQVRPDHPRLFFNRETWPAINARAHGAARKELNRLLHTCDAYPTNPVCTGLELPPPKKRKVKGRLIEVPYNGSTTLEPIRDWGTESANCALAWRFTGNRRYLELAKRMIRENARGYAVAYRNARAVNWYAFRRINTLCACDWIYEALTPEERRELIKPLLDHVEQTQRPPRKILRRNVSSWKQGCYGVPALAWYAGLLAAGDGIDDDAAVRFLKASWPIHIKMLEYRADGSGDDGPLASCAANYALGAYPYAHFNFITTVRTACGVDLAASYPPLALFPNFIWWMMIPNESDSRHPFEFGLGDTYHQLGFMTVGDLYEHMLQYAQVFRDADPKAAGLARTLADMAPNRSVGITFPIYRFMIDRSDLPPAISPAEIEKRVGFARHFETVGQFSMRSGSRPGDTFAVFNAGATLTSHKHKDENSFVIFKHDFLALDSGTRARQTDYNLRHYYAQTVAHNAILIHKPGEPLPQHWGVQLKDPAYNWNYGGQIPVSASVKAFETNPDWTYIASDAAACYGKKCRRALRQFVHVQPDFFIVYDRVENDAAYKTEFLLHVENEPTIDGSLFKADSRGGRLFCQTLLPRKSILDKVGGPDREFWANGRNWEVDEGYLAASEKTCKKAGRGPYFGKWRLEVRPTVQVSETHFLHVLTATESADGTAVKAELIGNAAEEGVRLTLPNGGKREFLFRKSGEPGGTVRIGDKPSKPLTTQIQPQKGVY